MFAQYPASKLHASTPLPGAHRFGHAGVNTEVPEQNLVLCLCGVSTRRFRRWCASANLAHKHTLLHEVLVQ